MQAASFLDLAASGLRWDHYARRVLVR